jgi:hypothetical protein
VRNLFILLLIVVGLAIVRSLVNDVIQAVKGSLDSGDKDAPSVASEKEKAGAKAAMSTCRRSSSCGSSREAARSRKRL